MKYQLLGNFKSGFSVLTPFVLSVNLAWTLAVGERRDQKRRRTRHEHRRTDGPPLTVGWMPGIELKQSNHMARPQDPERAPNG
jgi:hypothetical protein